MRCAHAVCQFVRSGIEWPMWSGQENVSQSYVNRHPPKSECKGLVDACRPAATRVSRPRRAATRPSPRFPAHAHRARSRSSRLRGAGCGLVRVDKEVGGNGYERDGGKGKEKGTARKEVGTASPWHRRTATKEIVKRNVVVFFTAQQRGVGRRARLLCALAYLARAGRSSLLHY